MNHQGSPCCSLALGGGISTSDLGLCLHSSLSHMWLQSLPGSWPPGLDLRVLWIIPSDSLKAEIGPRHSHFPQLSCSAACEIFLDQRCTGLKGRGILFLFFFYHFHWELHWSFVPLPSAIFSGNIIILSSQNFLSFWAKNSSRWFLQSSREGRQILNH